MVLPRLITEEIEQVGSGGPGGNDYGERLEEILQNRPFPAIEKPLARELARYREELEGKDSSREEYINRLEAILQEPEAKGSIQG